MLFELRTYDLKPGRAPVYLEKFRLAGVGLITAHLPMAGYWMTESGVLNRIYHLWAYESFEERSALRARVSADDAWMKEFIPDAFRDVIAQSNRFLILLHDAGSVAPVYRDRKAHHQNQDVEAPMFAEGLQAISTHSQMPEPTDLTMALFRTWTGQGPGEFVHLEQGNFRSLTSSSEFCRTHEILRPLSLSPLQ